MFMPVDYTNIVLLNINTTSTNLFIHSNIICVYKWNLSIEHFQIYSIFYLLDYVISLYTQQFFIFFFYVINNKNADLHSADG